MQQILNFVIKYKNTLLFIILLVISLGITIQSHAYHKSKFVTSTNAIVGGLYGTFDNVSDYFHLKQYNERLLVENTKLKNELSLYKKDSTVFSNLNDKNFNYIPAQIINSTYHKTKNYITLNKGEKDSIYKDMGVITDKGIIGIVDKSSTNFSRVISILNKNSQINAQLKKSNHYGSLIWNGNDTNVVQLIDIPRLAPVKIGDTIVTGGRSTIFPKGIPIGAITSFKLNEDKNYYTLNVLLFNDMTNIGFVNVINNPKAQEIKQLENTDSE